MRAFLDPGWRREFCPPKEADPLPRTRWLSDAMPAERRRVSERLEKLSEQNEGMEASQQAAAQPMDAGHSNGQQPRTQPRARRKGADESAKSEAQRTLWKAMTKDWLRAHDLGVEWELPKADERLILEWFHALDLDGSGSIDAAEIRALLAVSRSAVPAGRVVDQLFRLVGKRPDEELEVHDFAKLIRIGGATTLFAPDAPRVDDDEHSRRHGRGHGCSHGDLHGGTHSTRASLLGSVCGEASLQAGVYVSADPSGGQSSPADWSVSRGQPMRQAALPLSRRPPSPPATLSESRSSGDLVVLTYRRHRVLEDLRNPRKRAPFASRDAFARKYSGGERARITRGAPAGHGSDGASSRMDGAGGHLGGARHGTEGTDRRSRGGAGGNTSARVLTGEQLDLVDELTDEDRRLVREGSFLQQRLAALDGVANGDAGRDQGRDNGRKHGARALGKLSTSHPLPHVGVPPAAIGARSETISLQLERGVSLPSL